ncbi:hypothetical protein PoB_002184300 [Plakobranchus ocellatus]|uniref:Uncharacterized protein n=1 Tax=Plakobranchus ocellatus TaxID=259542 RepID=A0AAV3ZL66_9GAST|nr:hypothetical protein PoB_002184300 [Plakobranchus ocellatus]
MALLWARKILRVYEGFQLSLADLSHYHLVSCDDVLPFSLGSRTRSATSCAGVPSLEAYLVCNTIRFGERVIVRVWPDWCDSKKILLSLHPSNHFHRRRRSGKSYMSLTAKHSGIWKALYPRMESTVFLELNKLDTLRSVF